MNMDLGFINKFIVESTLIACLCVGYVLKHLIPSEKINKYIPLIVAVLGVAFSAWSNQAFTPDVVITGMVSGLASTGLHQAVKQVTKASE